MRLSMPLPMHVLFFCALCVTCTRAQIDIEIQLLRFKQLFASFGGSSLDAVLTLRNGSDEDGTGRVIHSGDVVSLDAAWADSNLKLQVDVSGGSFSSAKLKLDYRFIDDNPIAFQSTSEAPFATGSTLAFDTLGQIGRHRLIITVTYLWGLLEDRMVFNWWVPDVEPPKASLSPPSDIVTKGTAEASAIQAAGVVKGELRTWHTITLVFEGPMTNERALPNPFTDYRLDVVFAHTKAENGTTTPELLIVPGYYAADGNAANTSASSGNKWHCHFSPTLAGRWTWTAYFVTGSDVAMKPRNNVTDTVILGTPTAFHGANGTLMIQPTDKSGQDLRAKGLLRSVPGKSHLQFAETGEWFLKVGSDSPENFLAYQDFDNTPNYRGYRKSWRLHKRDYVDGDPLWAGGKGKGIIGAINYLSAQRMRAFGFLTYNANGDDQNVFPFVSKAERLRYDVSKLAQWEIVLEHATTKGLFLHFKTQEQESDQLLDGGGLGRERKIYYRELVARFGHHLALNWNLGEETTNTDKQRKEFADWIRSLDPYRHPIVVHTYPDEQSEVYTPLYGYRNMDGASIQSLATDVFQDTLSALRGSTAAGQPWVVTNDEQGSARTGVTPDIVDSGHFDIRHQVLWGNIMAGGAGVEYYFGYAYSNSDLTCQDFRSRANMWAQSRYAVDFFANNKIPFQDMTNENSRVSSIQSDDDDDDDDDTADSAVNWCLVGPSDIVIYLPFGGTADIDLDGWAALLQNPLVKPATIPRVVSIRWFDPRFGGILESGSVSSIPIGPTIIPVSIGNAPYGNDKDWVVLLRCVQGC